MKKSIKFLGFCMLGISLHTSVIAQEVTADDSLTLKKRIYRVSVITSDSKKNSGYLANLSDSNLYLSPTPLPLSLVTTKDYLSSYSYDHLEKIEIKRNASLQDGAPGKCFNSGQRQESSQDLCREMTRLRQHIIIRMTHLLTLWGMLSVVFPMHLE